MTKRAAQTHKWFVELEGVTKTGTASSEELANKARNSYVSRIEKENKRWPHDAIKILSHGVEPL